LIKWIINSSIFFPYLIHTIKGGKTMSAKRIVGAIFLFGALAFSASVVLGQTSKDFAPLIIELSGWECSEIETADVDMGTMKMISCQREYTKDGKTIVATVMIGQQAAQMWNPSYHEGFRMEVEGTLVEVKKINGFLVSTAYEKQSNTGTLIVPLIEISMGSGTGAIFMLGFEGMDHKEALNLGKKFDWNKMSALAKKM
jgi:hypothetical protein